MRPLLAVLPAAVVLLPLAVPLLAAGWIGADAAGAAGVPAHDDIPERAALAYVRGALHAAETHPGCRPPWSLLAGIGKVETDHGRFGGSQIGEDGRARPPILGVRLDGSTPGTRAVGDTDDGRWDGDGTADRAVGPMQFIPGTWAAHGVDGDGDGDPDPQDLDDAAAAAGGYLCVAVGGADLSVPAVQRRALLAYNRSAAYGQAVLALAQEYAASATRPVLDDGSGPIACPVAPPVTFIDSWHFPRSGGRVHLGQDMFADEGQPLVALAAGEVVEMRTGAGLGGTVLWLRTDGGHHWYYAHLQRFAAGLAPGDRVARGQVIGHVGRTGNARTTPPHLHIQWRPTGRRGADENPYALLSAACPGHAG